ncbi:MAG: hypothetical protein JNK33_06465 [Candidatus Doudnabacteria bacterium]|nr:hypothetical protein [Candidatus Doudnabacteria bacterium]
MRSATLTLRPPVESDKSEVWVFRENFIGHNEGGEIPGSGGLATAKSFEDWLNRTHDYAHQRRQCHKVWYRLVPRQPYPEASRLPSAAPDTSADVQCTTRYTSHTADISGTTAGRRSIHQDRVGGVLVRYWSIET